jgi:hypothetical protein
MKPLGVRFILGAFAASVSAVVLFLALVLVFHEEGKNTRFLEAKRKERRALAHLKPNPPSEERLAFLRSEAARLVKLSGDLAKTEVFWPKPVYSEEERLQFKEDLHAVRKRLEEDAARKKVLFEKEADLEVPGESLPPREKLAELFMALALSEELRSAAVDSGIPRISELNFPEAKKTGLGAGIERYEYVFGMKTNTNWWAVLHFLDALRSSRHLWRIENIIIENEPLLEGGTSPVPDAPLRVEMTLSATYFGRRVSHGSL